jgi:hypothetical protein
VSDDELRAIIIVTSPLLWNCSTVQFLSFGTGSRVGEIVMPRPRSCNGLKRFVEHDEMVLIRLNRLMGRHVRCTV